MARLLITGCNSGFGLLIAARAATAGHEVIATHRGEPSEALADLAGRNRVTRRHLDLASGAEGIAADLADAVGDGSLDGLINNAGRGSFGSLEDHDEAEV